jgi:hypothetical protein
MGELMIQEYAGDPVPGRWPQAGGRALYRSRDEIGPTARAVSAAQLAGRIGGGWLTLAAEMAGLTTGAWQPAPDPVSPDPAAPHPVSRDPAGPHPESRDPAGPHPVSRDPVSPDPVSRDPAAPQRGRPASASLPRVAIRTLSADAGSVHAARDFTVATLRRWGTAERSQDIALVVSELLTNALRHAVPGSVGDSRPSWPIRLGLLQPGSSVLCAVADPSRTAPVLQARGSLAETGRGLHLICALSDQWGFTPSDTGKVVWAMFFPRLTVFVVGGWPATRPNHPTADADPSLPVPPSGLASIPRILISPVNPTHPAFITIRSPRTGLTWRLLAMWIVLGTGTPKSIHTAQIIHVIQPEPVPGPIRHTSRHTRRHDERDSPRPPLRRPHRRPALPRSAPGQHEAHLADAKPTWPARSAPDRTKRA